MDPMDPMDPSKASILSSCVLDEMDEMGEKERESDTAELAEVFLNFYVFFRWLTVRQVTEPRISNWFFPRAPKAGSLGAPIACLLSQLAGGHRAQWLGLAG